MNIAITSVLVTLAAAATAIINAATVTAVATTNIATVVAAASYRMLRWLCDHWCS